MRFEKVNLLAGFKQLREVEFYKYEDLDSIGVMQSVFPDWELQPTTKNKTKYRLVFNAETGI